MKQVIFNQTGLPKDVLFIEEAPMPIRHSHEVLVKVLARNINPSDIMFVQGLYGITPQLPSSAGFRSLYAIHTSNIPPTSINPGIFSKYTTINVMALRTKMAPTAPHTIAFF